MADFSRLPGPNADLWDWQLLAACRGVDSSLFFHPEGERGAARSARENSAKEVCMRCSVRAECAAHALAVREPYGVWGGLTEDEREELMGRARNRTPAPPQPTPNDATTTSTPAPAATPGTEPDSDSFSETIARTSPDYDSGMTFRDGTRAGTHRDTYRATYMDTDTDTDTDADGTPRAAPMWEDDALPRN